MRKFAKLVALFSLLSLLTLPSLADENNFAYTFQVLRASEAPQKKICSSEAWQKFLAKPGTSIVEELGGSVVFNRPFLLHPGIKVPLPYTDPRAGMSQVQYTDQGFKLDTRVNKRPDGLLEISARGERSISNPHPTSESRISSIIFESETLMRRGQVAIFGCAQGPMVERLIKDQFPAGTFRPGDWVILAVTIE